MKSLLMRYFLFLALLWCLVKASPTIHPIPASETHIDVSLDDDHEQTPRRFKLTGGPQTCILNIIPGPGHEGKAGQGAGADIWIALPTVYQELENIRVHLDIKYPGSDWVEKFSLLPKGSNYENEGTGRKGWWPETKGGVYNHQFLIGKAGFTMIFEIFGEDAELISFANDTPFGILVQPDPPPRKLATWRIERLLKGLYLEDRDESSSNRY